MSIPVLRREKGRIEALGVLLIHPDKNHKVQVVCAPYAAAPDYWMSVYDLMNILSTQGWRPYVQRLMVSQGMTLRERWITWLQRRVDRLLARRALSVGLITFEDPRFDKIRAKTLKTRYLDVETKEYVGTFTGSLLVFSAKTLLGLVHLKLSPAFIIRAVLTDMEPGTATNHGLHPDDLTDSRARVLADACSAESGNVYMLVTPRCLPAVIDRLLSHGYDTDEHSTYYQLAYTQ